MTPRRLAVLVAACASLFLPLAAPTPSRHRGNLTSIATNWNLTTRASPSPSPSPSSSQSLSLSLQDGNDSVANTTATPDVVVVTPSSLWPNPTAPVSGTGPVPSLGNHTRVPSNDSGPPCTIHVPQASFDWWYAATFGSAVGILKTVSGNYSVPYLTNHPNTETFDVTSALNGPAWTPSLSYDPEWDETYTFFFEYTVTPSATVTSVVSRSAYSAPIPPGTAIPQRELYLYQSDLMSLDPATLAIGGRNGSGYTATSATPVVHFSAYEVETEVPITGNDGQVTRTTITQTHSLPKPYAAPYWVKGVENSAEATGTVPAEFLELIPQASCSAGMLTGSVTVLVVVDLYYIQDVLHNPFKIHIESTVLGFETDDEMGVHGTEIWIPPPESEGPRVEITADGFTTPSASIKPAVVPTRSSAPDNQGQGNPDPSPQPEPTEHTVGTIGTAPVVIGPSSVVRVGTETLSRGSRVTVGGSPVSLDPSGSAIVVGTRTSVLPPVFPQDTGAPRPPPLITVGRSTLTPNAATQFFLGPGQTLTPGGTATLDGTRISLGSSATFAVVGGSTQFLLPAPFPTAAPPATIVVGGSTFTQNPGSSFVIGSQTLGVGGVITVDSTVVSLGPSFVVVNQATSTFPAALPAGGPPQITVGSSTITADPQGNFVVDGQTLAPGGPAITVDGSTTLSLAGNNVLVSNGVSSTIANPAAQITAPPLTVGNSVFTALPGLGTTYLIDGQRLTPGGVITVDGTTISLAPGATALVINGVTTSLNPSSALITNAPLLTIGSETYTAVSGSTFVIDGQTLTPGGVITVDGTTISLSPGATQLVVESAGRKSTRMLFPATTTRDVYATGTGAAGPGPGATGFDGKPAQTAKSDALRSLRFNFALLVFFVLAALLLH